jgi:type VI secretion system secreted protein VgrG
MTRPVSVVTPLGADVLQFRQMKGEEELGRLFTFTVDLISTDPEVDLGNLVGKSMAVQLELPQGGQRFFHGVIASFDQVSDLGRYAEYRAILRPWLWRLTMRAGCRIFQHLSVP